MCQLSLASTSDKEKVYHANLCDRTYSIFLSTDQPEGNIQYFKMARMALTIDFEIPKLNGANYRDWTFNMRLYLESLDLFGHVDGSMGVPNEEASEQVP